MCDDKEGNHWIALTLIGRGGIPYFKGLGNLEQGFCKGSRYFVQWADVNGDGKADMLCK